MKKISLVLLLLAVIVGLVGPKFAGDAFNEQLDEFAAKISEQPFYTANVEYRDQTWFTTTAALVISVDNTAFGITDRDAAQAGFSFNVPIRAQHGPFLTQSGLRLGWVDWQVDLTLPEPNEHFTLAEGGEFIYSAEGIVGLFGATSYTDFMPSFTFTDSKSGVTVSSNGWQGNARLTADSIDYQTEQSISFEVSVQGSKIASIKNMSLNADIDAGLTQIWEKPLYNSLASLTIDTITFGNPAADEETRIDNIVVDTVTTYDETSELGSMLLSYKVASLVSSKFAMQNIQLDVEVNHMASRFVKAYQKLTEDIVNAPEQKETLVQAFVEEFALAQLQVNPELNIPVIKGVINKSTFNGFAKAKLVGIQAIPATAEDMAFWAEHAVVDAKLTLQEEAALFITKLILKSQLAANPQFVAMSEAEQETLLAQQAQTAISTFVQQGILSEVDEGYEITFSMENAEAMLNGQPMGLPF